MFVVVLWFLCLDENRTKILVKLLLDQGKEEYLSSSDMNKTVCTDSTENLDPANIQELEFLLETKAVISSCILSKK